MTTTPDTTPFDPPTSDPAADPPTGDPPTSDPVTGDAPPPDPGGDAGETVASPRSDALFGEIAAVRPAWALVIRSFAFVRKEIVEILRQPRLIALLVLGPFALLIGLGMGYGNDSFERSAVFVGSADSIYATVLETYEDDLENMLDSRGMIESLPDAMAMLRSGEVDVVVAFPERPLESVLAGERAEIQVMHSEIDPFQARAVDVAAQLAVQEVNATVLETIVTSAQAELRTTEEYSERFAGLATQVEADPGDAAATARQELAGLEVALEGTARLLDRFEASDPALRDDVDRTRELVDRASASLAEIDDDATGEDVAALSDDLAALGSELGDTMLLEPSVLVRPFTSATENVGIDTATPTEYFTPSSIALLLQHLALTFAALSLVRDRRTGLFELMRVGPLSSIEIVVGKIFAYVVVGASVGAMLVTVAVLGLGVTFAGSVGWLAAIMLGVLLSSLALGMLIALVSWSESQAVQMAMLVLLASLFFTGFVLPIDTLRYPVKIVSFLIPVTYGIEGLHDIMLRGIAPRTGTLVGLGALVLVYGVVAVAGLTRRLRAGTAS